MNDLSEMSWAELVRELMAPVSPARVCEPSASRIASSRRYRASDPVLARRLALARELLLRDLGQRLKDAPVFGSPCVVREWLVLKYGKLEHEVFVLLYLDSQNRLIECEELFRGTLQQTAVYPREVVKRALLHNAASLVAVHNHPGGVCEASQADRLLTQQLKVALELVDVRIIDHFIVAGARTYSFAEHGLL